MSTNINLVTTNSCLIIALLFLANCTPNGKEKIVGNASIQMEMPGAEFTYQTISGIGLDSLYNRRDNSDIIKVGDTYYIWYSRMDRPITAGYWATIWYATSKDEGYSWQEQGMALGLGNECRLCGSSSRAFC